MSNTLRPTCNDCGTDTRGATVHLIKMEGLGYAMVCEDCQSHRFSGGKVIRTFPWQPAPIAQCHCGRNRQHSALYVIEHDGTGEVAYRCEADMPDEVRAGGIITDVLPEMVTRSNVLWRLEQQLWAARNAYEAACDAELEAVYHVQTAPAHGPYLMDAVMALCEAREAKNGAERTLNDVSRALDDLASTV